jgi:hypothetical protein
MLFLARFGKLLGFGVFGGRLSTQVRVARFVYTRLRGVEARGAGLWEHALLHRKAGLGYLISVYFGCV